MSKLFSPLDVGSVKLEHRIAMAPLTRYRATDDLVPMKDIVKEYYEQRASVPGTLLITEATQISPRAIGRSNVPGIWTGEQVAAWREIVDAIHAKGCFVYLQLWHLGRGAFARAAARAGFKVQSASAVPIDEDSPVPEAMTEGDIRAVIADYAAAARSAVEGAGFDGVEIHAANGYLPDQFLQDVSNRRTDGWGGSVEKRARFALEVTKAVVGAVGAERTAIRLSPFSDFQGMLMDDPHPTFEYLVRELKKLGRLAYLHLIEARISGNDDAGCGSGNDVGFLVKIWDNTSPVLIAGGIKPDTARELVDEKYKDYDVVAVFGRYFVSNPDLVFRVKEGVELEKYDRSVFYTPKLVKGYTDYPFSKEFLARAG
ncbi:hypothetical protein NKR23_g9658 [Pleurostoma richardsiae]|uniref:NADH:flavin oxidoreductase/NADH oxidase N-terminal domain-containing protein n=1 Tax=Pleurostoma richardsiae TaxID=41990 RepID=A0AA38R5M2_9PEZI|nr:hypothetical protein NKR23_g9658 [Pleurostoma richardsiae]